jgi:hypothetical protein
MTTEEGILFSQLLFDHKGLWVTLQTYRYLQEHPEMDWGEVHERFSLEAYEVYQSLANAVLDEQPLQDPLKTVLLNSLLTMAELRDQKRNR